jgi:hypothetical protein
MGEHSRLRFITMSPGNTAGTQALRDLPPPMRVLAQRVLMPCIAPAPGVAHKLEEGAQRLLTAVTDPALLSGAFYASKVAALAGPVAD